ncbi:penicillin-binding protein 1C [Mucilaginibacter myungsuensis]|uniref:peptidoglycan glycosyltransferase n=1 Tax=Mucilaginibacter myungsuensis TaxID=649104 RepID=A0A929KXF8_9SPHI|nr:penicillin-binding protein 1C [Mucilaginibacter myungsuensis]MBE9660689.1 penicillin-binding protein 1C [Mucilaginibacter myungsuensis]MDN3600734.1 penicillin-binding protein 1C [Mucilaginibacter myungsuensis]
MKTPAKRYLYVFKTKRPAVISVVTLSLLVAFWFCLPKPLFDTPTSYVIEDEQGQLLGATIATDGQWRFPANSKVPEKFKVCIIAFEDKRFMYHPGVDPLAFGRAIRQNIKAKHVTSGGSTLTMQVIRLATKHKRNLWNKLLEMAMAVRLEVGYSKEEILTLYAGNAPFGSNVVGLEAACWRYFGRTPDQLSWGEMAAMAVLPNSPALVHPGKNRKALLRKRNSLLDRLVWNGTIDSTTADLAKLEPMPDNPVPLPRSAPHLLQRFRKEHLADKGNNTRTRTTIKASLQEQVSDIVERHHQLLKANGINNMAAVVLDVESGATLAYVGNISHPEDPALESDVDVIGAPRSPGSTLKPLLYANMMHDGLILPNSLIPDIPTQIAGYHPENFDLGYDGAIPASRALSRSLNVPAVKMLQKFKYERFYDFLKKEGMTTLNKPADHYGLSLILGGGENTLWELSGAYANMARVLNHHPKYKGQYDPADYHQPVYQKRTDKVESQLEKNGLLNASAIYYTLQAMEEVMRPGEEMLWQQFASTQRVAWKTGTSFGFRDGWAIGITPKYVVGVWVGNTTGEGRPDLTGIKTAAPAMFEIFRLLPLTREWFPMPVSAMANIKVCRQSGFRAGGNCDNPDDMYVPKAGLKSPVCPYHQLVHLDRTEKYQVNADCEDVGAIVTKNWFVLPPSTEYYYRTKNYQYKTLPPFRAGCPVPGNSNTMELIYPRDGASVYIPLEADGQRGRMICNAAHRQAGMKVFWHLDEKYIGQTTDRHQMEILAAPGNHVITLVDANSNELTVRFKVEEKKSGSDKP